MPSVTTISYPSNDGEQTSRSIRCTLRRLTNRVYTAFYNFGRFPSRERNLFSAFFTLLALTVLSAALADEEWIYLEGGKCALKHIGVSLFYGWGYFQHRSTMESMLDENGQVAPPRPRTRIIYTVGGKSYYDCVNPTIADVFHGLMGVLFVAVATTLTQFILDTFGVKQGFLAWLRRNSIFNVFAVVFCVIIIGLTYWVSLEVEQQQRSAVANPETVHVSFEDGFYLVVAGATFSICALVANLIESTIQIKRRCEDRLALLEHAERNEMEGSLASGLSSRENLLQHYRHHRLFNTAMSASRAQLPFTEAPMAGSTTGQMMITERPIGSMGPPPPLQMILNVPPPPPYAP